MRLVLFIVWTPILVYLSFAILYHVFLATSYFIKPDKDKGPAPNLYKYLVLIPAHNEESLIGRLLESLRNVKYDSDDFRVAIIADNCVDQTAAIAYRHDVDVLIRRDPSRKGKGFAIAWALERVDLDRFDAVVIVDADNIVDPLFFHGLNEVMARGSNAIQCYNALANPDETAFTRIIHASRTVNNNLYHSAKYKLGLSSFLMGNGMCLTTKLLKEYGWVTSTMAEDLEYYAKLIQRNEMIGFASNSKLYHQESRGIHQATDQRLRWSSGKFRIARTHGYGLLKQGLIERNYKKVDASLPLILPNLSLMVNITAVALLASVLVHLLYPMPIVVGWLLFLLVLEILYFSAGIYLTRMPIRKVLHAFGFAPVFLVWKAFIDLKGILGKEMTQWGRSNR